MTAPTTSLPDTDGAVAIEAATAPGPSRVWVALVVAGAMAAAVGAGMLLTALRGPVVVTPTFTGGDAVATEWGSAEAYGRPGSWVLGYRDGETMTMALPWSGGEVAEARLGDGPVDLATIVDADVRDGELVTTISFDGCNYYNERELEVFPAVTVVTAAGDSAELVFDRPLYVRSPMLWQCPDRNIDRWADNRSDL